MNYDYNANLTFEERVSIITKDIINKYPFINKETAIKIASLEEPIDNNKEDIIFKRLSNILLFYQNDINKKNIIINDILKEYRNLNDKDEKINKYISDILDYQRYDIELPLYK